MREIPCAWRICGRARVLVFTRGVTGGPLDGEGRVPAATVVLTRPVTKNRANESLTTEKQTQNHQTKVNRISDGENGNQITWAA